MTTITALLIAPALAQDLNFSQYRKFLMSGNNKPSNIAIQTTCTNKSGTTFRVGEKGYDLCLTELSNSTHQKNAKGATDGSSTEPGPTVNIHIGN